MHYEDDTFHPSNDTDFDDFEYQNIDQSAFSDTISYTTINSRRNKSKKDSDNTKNGDKGYHKIKIPYGRKEIEIEVYTTPITPGKPIRDAITGARFTKHLVGSLDENLYFKTVISTGKLGTDAGLLFYDSPEQFERHLRTTVSQEIKQKWTDKCIAARLRKYEE